MVEVIREGFCNRFPALVLRLVKVSKWCSVFDRSAFTEVSIGGAERAYWFFYLWRQIGRELVKFCVFTSLLCLHRGLCLLPSA